ncbi:CyP450 monooxygenase [Ganoderma leucocontextum]|nr:CyP450 monooxygenase [Ganoderma leucocontextum]
MPVLTVIIRVSLRFLRPPAVPLHSTSTPRHFPSRFDTRRMVEPAAVIVLVLGCGLAVFAYTARRNHSLSMPPGPRRLPLLGNIFNFPKSLDPQAFYELTRKYGDIVHLNVLGQRMIILGSYSTALDLLHIRSAMHSDRESSVMAELSGISWILLLLPYGQAWRQGRKVLHRFFDSIAVSQFHSTQERQTRLLLNRLFETPDAFVDHLHLFVGATIMDITYGLDVAGSDNRFVALLADFAEAFEAAFAPGKYLVEMFPLLRNVPAWFPWATFHRDASLYRESFSAMRNEPFDRTLENMRRGEGNPCMVSALMDDHSDGEMTWEDEQVARDAAGVIYMGGADTVHASLQVFFLAMVLHPETQKKAQAELDTIVGRARLPQMTDFGSLPYIQALVLEVLRWKPIIGLGFPHKSRSDDVFRGYSIPKGSLIFASSWAISRDPQMYPDPDNFIPERFLKDGALRLDVLDPRLYAFGHGRRICPGRHFAEASLFIAVASVLHAFSIKPRCDVSGVPKLPEGKMKPGFLSFPETFECEISSRSEKVEAVIKSEWANLQ